METISKEIVSSDLPEAFTKLEDIMQKVNSLTSKSNELLKKVENKEFSTAKGVSFLEMKYHLMLEYLINLAYLVYLKVDGKPLSNDPTIDRLIEIRTVLERIRPIDQKLRYQVDKLIKASKTGSAVGRNDPLQFRPNPDALVNKMKDEDDDKNNSAVYVPPKVAAMPFEEVGFEAKKRKVVERARRHALNSAMLKDLKEQYLDDPEEFKDSTVKHLVTREKEEDVKRFEEDNLIRLPNKKSHKKLRNPQDSLDNITKFDDLSILTAKESQQPIHLPKKRNKKIMKGKKNKHKGKGRKRKF